MTTVYEHLRTLTKDDVREIADGRESIRQARLNEATAERLRAQYGVPARIGARITFERRPGTVVGFDHKTGDPLIKLDGTDEVLPVHPRWEMTWDDENGPATHVPQPQGQLPLPPLRMLDSLFGIESQWSGI